MSFLIAARELVAAAATDLARVGSTVNAANIAASGPTTAVIAAGSDEVSAGIAASFGAHAEAYQALGAQAATFHSRFVQALHTGATTYVLAEAAKLRLSRLCSKTCST
jgi:hypothetical protein